MKQWAKENGVPMRVETHHGEADVVHGMFGDRIVVRRAPDKHVITVGGSVLVIGPRHWRMVTRLSCHGGDVPLSMLDSPALASAVIEGDCSHPLVEFICAVLRGEAD